MESWLLIRRDRAASAVVALLMWLVLLAPPLQVGQANAAMLDRMLLWRVVHLMCVPGAQHGNPAPCQLVDLGNGVDSGIAVLAVPFKKSEILVVPTRRVAGIESPELQSDAANYWNEAWHQRTAFESRLGRPVSRDWIGMAVNSAVGRDQDQLHIHVDCVAPDVREALRSGENGRGSGWMRMRLGSTGHTYLVHRVAGEDLSEADLFKMVHDGLPSMGRDMGKVTIVVIGSESRAGKPGFYVLAHRADTHRGDYGSGVELLDNSCALRR